MLYTARHTFLGNCFFHIIIAHSVCSITNPLLDSINHRRYNVSVKPVVIIGADWCGDCRRARQFLDTYDIPYQWIDIDVDKHAEQIVLEINQGFRSIPTILFEDGSTLVEPTNFDLITKLDLMN